MRRKLRRKSRRMINFPTLKKNRRRKKKKIRMLWRKKCPPRPRLSPTTVSNSKNWSFLKIHAKLQSK